MSFVADKQTLEDLNLTGKYKAHSIYSLFNKVRTAGGERLLEQLYNAPLTDANAINQRSQRFAWFQQQQLTFPFDREQFSLAEEYLSHRGTGSLLTAAGGLLSKKMMQLAVRDEQYHKLQTGLVAAIDMLCRLDTLVQPMNSSLVEPARKILSSKRLSWIRSEAGRQSFNIITMAKYHHLLRTVLNRDMETLLDIVYQLDVYIAVSTVARDKNLGYAQALPAAEHTFSATALWHPALPKAVPNALTLNRDHNLLFLTGANMAGKSTFMKSFGIAVYLAHLGFPVAATGMQFSVRDGLYSSINVPDNLNLGYSHFYAEVMRVKQAAAEVSNGKNMIVIFDELFKGTNVKDAFEATLTVSAGFSKYRNCLFIISTHIIEVGEALQEYPNIQFAYLPTIMNQAIPTYTYQLAQGITEDRHGMMIIQNEKIIDMLKSS